MEDKTSEITQKVDTFDDDVVILNFVFRNEFVWRKITQKTANSIFRWKTEGYSLKC